MRPGDWFGIAVAVGGGAAIVDIVIAALVPGWLYGAAALGAFAVTIPLSIGVIGYGVRAGIEDAAARSPHQGSGQRG